MLNNILLCINITLMYSTPLIFGALGGVLTQKSGVDNLGIEGMMTIGAFGAAAVGYFTGNPWIGFLVGGLCGAVLAAMHAIASISFRANQIISGVALNFIGAGAALFLCRIFFNNATQSNAVPNKMPTLLGLFGIRSGSPLNINMTFVLAVCSMLLLWFIFYKTKWGLRIMACGEHPAAADTLGVSVYAVRYICAILAGVLAGFGGASMTLDIVSNFAPAVISGHGFIALAAVIFGKWSPIGATAACLLFGFAQALVVLLVDFQVPTQLMAMLPYVITLLVLVLFVGRSEAPKANGQPYIKGQR